MAKGTKGFEKGKSGNPGGRPKGSKDKKTLAWEELGDLIVNEGAERFTKILGTLDEEEFVKHYLMILEYFKPKQSRQENTGEQTININWEEVKTYEVNPETDSST